MILNPTDYHNLPEEEKSNYRTLWLYQKRGTDKWKIEGSRGKYKNFAEYSDKSYNEKDRATKEIFIQNCEPKPGDKIAVYFSCGAASFMAAKMALAKYGHICEVVLVNNPIKEEDDDNQRFLRDAEVALGVKIHKAINSKYPSCSAVEVWDDRQYMSGVDGAPCTLELKKKARYEWELKNRPDWTIMGFTKEEQDRFDNFQLNERPASIHILKEVTKAECFFEVVDMGLKLPEQYTKHGMPNANCDGCPKATSPTYWNHLRVVKPLVFATRAKQSREIGAKLVRVKGVRIYLDELDPTAKGGELKDMNFECGIFCGI